MKKDVLKCIRLAFYLLLTTFFVNETKGSDSFPCPCRWHSEKNERALLMQKVNIRNHAMRMLFLFVQQPNDSLTRKEIKALKKKERAEEREQVRVERQENSSVIDNPSNADYILLGDDLPRGSSVLNAIRGRVPGMTISSDGNVIVNGPTTYRANSTVLYLVDEREVGRDYINSMPIEDIERIEIFTGPSIAMFGSRAGAAVISIYSKHAARNANPLE